jgi:preprotein translocase subunit SecG
MDTHGQENKAGPQNDSSSVFRGGAISQGEKQAVGLMNNGRNSNPYRLGQSSHAEHTKEPFETGPSMMGGGLWQQIKGKLFREEPGVGNTRQKVMVILILILFIIMIFMFRQVLSKAPQETEGSTNDDSSVATMVSSDGEIDWRIPEPISMQIRDPIKPGVRTGVPNEWQTDSNNLDMLSVRGILYSQDKPSAVIGNRIVHLNDKIDNATIVQIDRDFVIFEKNGKRWMKKVAELQMEQEEWEQIKPDEEIDKIY